MEVADDGHLHALLRQPLHDLRHSLGGGIVIHRHPDQLRSGAGQRGHLGDGSGHIRRVRVGHRLHHNGCISAQPDAADRGHISFFALDCSHRNVFSLPFGIRGCRFGLKRGGLDILVPLVTATIAGR